MSLRTYFCSAVALLGAISCACAGAAIPASERDALIALFNSTDGAHWADNDGWNGAAGTECTWDGVVCDDGGNTVIGLYLSYNNLSGTLTPLTALTNLQHFDVSASTLSGPIPTLSTLSKLEYFAAAGCALKGLLPSLAGLSQLQVFNVDSNQLTGSFPSLDGLVNLEYFDIGDNAISGTLPSLSAFTKLQTFYVSGNKLQGPLPDLSRLTALQDFEAAGTFTLDGNNFTGHIPSLTGLTALQKFDVGTNLLTGPVPSLQGLTSLQGFVVSGNGLDGPIPSLNGLTNLVYFSVYGNNLTGPVPDISGHAQLQVFSAGYNLLNGPIAPLTNLPALTEYDVDHNALTGTIPPIAGLSALQIFDVDINQLNGNLPSLGGMTALQDFEAGNNHLTGHIPDLSGLTALVGFQVQGNDLDGPLPALALPNLQQLVIDNNRLSGTLPSFAGVPALQGFYAGSNLFTGPIPSLTVVPKLQRFYVDGDQLNGNVPDLTGLSQLQYFSVAGNKLTGTLPAITGSPQLIDFDASYNGLTGPIPALTGLVNLQTLYLGFNRLSGSVPALTGLSALQTVAIDDNQLDGTLSAFSGLTNLQSFVAENNHLQGTIPPLAGLTNLVVFNVAMNNLGGSIPALAGLTKLELFDVSYNHLDGSIPALTGLIALQQFYAGFNALSGSIPDLTGLVNLQYFAVDDNQIGGNLPALVGLNNLIAFLAASNAIEGSIPPLTGLVNLQLFEVGNNRLSGNIPQVPQPDNLAGGLSSLCPNNLVPTSSAAWDDATGESPWFSICSSNESQEAHGTATTKDSSQIAFSRDGAIEVFQSQQTDLTANNTNAGGQDIYSFGADGAPLLESVDSAGNKLVGSASAPAVSPDGQVIAFLFTPAAAKNDSAKDAKDFVTGQIWAGARGQPKHQIDMGMGGIPANGPAATAPTLSSAGGVNQVAFCSAASNLVPNDGNSGRDIFIADPLNPASALQRVSVDSSGSEIAGDSCEPKLSGDGSNLVFSLSSPSRFGTPARQIVLKKLSAGKVFVTGQLIPVTANAAGQGASNDSAEPTISQDGSVVAFTSGADLDGAGAPVGGKEVFVSLAQPSGTRLLKRARSGDGTVPDGASQHPQVTDDGTALVMQTAARNFLKPKSLDKADATTTPQCGAVAITTNFFAVTSLGGPLCTSDGKTLNQSPSISGDGTQSGFDSNAQQANGNTNRNAFSQGLGEPTGLTVLPANLSGDYSGQWLDPTQSGQGLVIDVIKPDANNNRNVLLTWFVFSKGQPTWLQGSGPARAGTGPAANTVVVQMDQVGIFQGAGFPVGEPSASATVWGSITLTFTDSNTGKMTWRSAYPGFSSGSMPIKHFLAVALPKDDASGAQLSSCYSGNWFNPAQNGHGFEFEVLPTSPPQLAVDWFAYAPDGSPVWLYGAGLISGKTAQVPLRIIDGAGAQFPPNFNPTSIVQHDWGVATFTFTDSGHGSVTWSSTYPGYNSGTQPLQPVFGPGLLDRRGCP